MSSPPTLVDVVDAEEAAAAENAEALSVDAEPDLTPELAAKIVKMTEFARWPIQAAQYCGVSRAQWRGWMRLAEQMPRSVYGRLRREVEMAVRRAEFAMLASVRKRAANDGKLALALLEKWFPERWGDGPRDGGRGGSANAEVVINTYTQIVYGVLEQHPELRMRIAEEVQRLLEGQRCEESAPPKKDD